MRSRGLASPSAGALALLLSFAHGALSAENSTAAQVWFENALDLDVGAGGAPDARMAFIAMRRAAEAGDAQAAFNVAIMLDSGRGTDRHVSEAAFWYARAAARGERRGAFNLGMLYESGEGVEANIDLARAWYAASGLPAARERIANLRSKPLRPASVEAPKPLFPAANGPLEIGQQVELVWTSRLEPEPVRYFVELRGFDGHALIELWSGFVDVSSLRLPLPDAMRSFAWRVSAVARSSANYTTSRWSIFTVPQTVATAVPAAPPAAAVNQAASLPTPVSGQRASTDAESPATPLPETKAARATPAAVSPGNAGISALKDFAHSEQAEDGGSKDSHKLAIAQVVPRPIEAPQDDGQRRIPTVEKLPKPGPQLGSPTVLIILAQPSIAKLSDLNDKPVVIAGMNSVSQAVVGSALSAAGASAVRLTEGAKGDVDELLDGDVSAAVIANVSAEKARSFPEISGLRIFRVSVFSPVAP